jgi:hypothetical protein
VEPIRLSESFDASPDEIIRVIRENRLEGVVAKRRDSLYEPGLRTGAWLKMRVNRGQEFVIGGYIIVDLPFAVCAKKVCPYMNRSPWLISLEALQLQK